MMKSEDGMGRECSTYGTDEKCVKIVLEYLNGRDHSDVLAVDGKITLIWI
jgi:hypothetical protein